MNKDKNGTLIILGIPYTCVLVFWIIYSYTQIDLNLTLSANPFYQSIQNQLIQVGYYQRGLSTVIFATLLVSLFILYLVTLQLINSKRISIRGVKSILIISFMLILTYPSFSHDLFNYMFDSKIVAFYHLSPGVFRALDFPQDPWVRFMHWTHRYYPYGAVWLWLTWIPTLLGMGKFVLTLIFYKIFFLIFHILNIFLIFKLLNRIHKSEALWGAAFYGLNPLVLIESLMSPHNEVVMLAFALLGIWLLFTKNYILSSVFLLLSAGIKFISIIILPITWVTSINSSNFYKIVFYAWLVGLIPVILQREPYSWYFIPLVGLSALCLDSKIIPSFAISVSIALMSRYGPYLLTGEYTSATYFKGNILFATVTVAVFLFMAVFYNNFNSLDSTSVS